MLTMCVSGMELSNHYSSEAPKSGLPCTPTSISPDKVGNDQINKPETMDNSVTNRMIDDGLTNPYSEGIYIYIYI